jgi:hypothetical protein
VVRAGDRPVPDAVRSGRDATGVCMESPQGQSPTHRVACPMGLRRLTGTPPFRGVHPVCDRAAAENGAKQASGSETTRR